MAKHRAMLLVLLVVLWQAHSGVMVVDGLDNGAALRPPMGWQNWNGFGMAFNASLFREMAAAMKANGMLAAGYNLLSAGGSTYPHQGLPPRWNSTNDTNIINVIVRNSTGYYQIDPARFPGPGSSAECLDEQGCASSCSPAPARSQHIRPSERSTSGFMALKSTS